jgi:indolepyruvate ferredoxin oxidoreductase beta subunit
MNPVILHPGTPIKIAILAMGGQGGGVLADWIVDMGEHAGWWAQTTSVPGVAQRTGATIYYLELLPEADAHKAGRPPALAMMPTPGDVDIVVSAELMEAGRAMQRGLVTPQRTTLITSAHRSLAVAEKAAPGNGIADPNKVLEAGRIAAKRFLCFDMQALAEKAGSMISATMFGALAGAGVLPFSREEFEATIRRGGVGAEASLRAFALGFEGAAAAPATPATIASDRAPLPALPERAAHPAVQALLERLRQDFPPAVQGLALAGVRRLIDYQDVDYAAEYLGRLAELHALDARHGGAGRDWALSVAAARYLAVAMSYDDVIRVADLKTRGSRFARVREEVGAKAEHLVYTTEFMHPRLEEVCGTLPVGLGRWLQDSQTLGKWLDKRFNRGRRLQSGTLTGFLLLYLAAGMRRLRRSTLRHQIETEHIRAWLADVVGTVGKDYALAVEMVNCRRLIKGYSDTHERGDSKFARLMEVARQMPGQPDAAGRLARLRDAALADENGDALRRELALNLKAA